MKIFFKRLVLGMVLVFTFHLSPFTSVYAQRIHATLSGGLTLSQIEGDELKGFTKWGFTGGVGAITAFDRNKTWNLSVEALFSQRGCYNSTGDPYSIKLRLDYIEIPLLIHWRDPWGGMLIGTGLSYSRLVQQPHGIMLFDTNYFIPDSSDLTFLSNDLAVVLDIQFPVWKKLKLDIRWQYSLIAVKRDWHFREYDGEEPRLGPDGTPVLDGNGKPIMVARWKDWTNNARNHSLMFRLIWEF